MATFPLPASRSLQSGWSERERDDVIRSNMGYGPAQLRRRTSVRMDEGTRAFIVSDAEKITLDNFYDANASVTWDWDEGDGARDYRYMTTPVAEPITCNLWSYRIQIEVMP